MACIKCNVRKAGRTPEQANMKLLSVPKKPTHNLMVGDIRVNSWQNFIENAYWFTELDHDED